MNIVWTILLGLLVFGLMIFVHELGHFLCAKATGVRVNEFALGMGPTLFKFGKGETTYALRLFPIGGFVSMEGEEEESDDEGSFSRKPVWKRLIIVLAGAVMNLLLGFLLLLSLVLMKDALASKTISNFDQAAVSNVGDNALQIGDEIVKINGKSINIGNDISYALIRDKDGIVDFTVRRDGELVELKGVAFDMYDIAEGQRAIVLDFKVLPLEKTFGSVLHEAFFWTVSIGDLVWGSLIDLVTGNFALNQLSGPVGVVTVIGEAASVGFDSLLLMIAFITINLGIFNMLPFPALDGGRFVFLIVEGIRRKPINPKIENGINMAGFALLILLMIVVTVNDVIKLF